MRGHWFATLTAISIEPVDGSRWNVFGQELSMWFISFTIGLRTAVGLPRGSAMLLNSKRYAMSIHLSEFILQRHTELVYAAIEAQYFKMQIDEA